MGELETAPSGLEDKVKCTAYACRDGTVHGMGADIDCPVCGGLGWVYGPQDGDLKVEVFRDSSAIKVTHTPTQISAYVTSAAAQHTNRAIAMDMIAAALSHPKFRG